MFVIGRVSPSSKGYAFYVGDFKMLAELLPSNAQQRWGWRVEMRTECRREKSPVLTKAFSVRLGRGTLSKCQASDKENNRPQPWPLFSTRDAQNRSMRVCLPNRKPHSLPNSTALNLKIETKVDLSLDACLKCPIKEMTALPGSNRGLEAESKRPHVFP